MILVKYEKHIDSKNKQVVKQKFILNAKLFNKFTIRINYSHNYYGVQVKWYIYLVKHLIGFMLMILKKSINMPSILQCFIKIIDNKKS